MTLELVPERSGEYEFTCQLGVLRGRLVVTGDPVEGAASYHTARTWRARPPWPRRSSGEHGDTTLLAFVVWLGSLPLLLLAAVPFLGWRGSGMLALLWFGIVAGACFAVCVHGVRRRSMRTSS